MDCACQPCTTERSIRGSLHVRRIYSDGKDQLKSREDAFARSALIGIEGREIVLPERFVPDGGLVRWHRENVFLDE